MHMIMFVLDDPNQLDAVLAAWESIGVGGATIVESTGIRRRRAKESRIPFRFDFGQLARHYEEGHYTLFAVVEGEDMVHKCLTATESVVGDLDEPNTGVLAAWPLGVVKGAHKSVDRKTDE
jgi:hypothetical protein